jgi:hypothetical protein
MDDAVALDRPDPTPNGTIEWRKETKPHTSPERSQGTNRLREKWGVEKELHLRRDWTLDENRCRTPPFGHAPFGQG